MKKKFAELTVGGKDKETFPDLKYSFDVSNYSTYSFMEASTMSINIILYTYASLFIFVKPKMLFVACRREKEVRVVYFYCLLLLLYTSVNLRV